MSEFSGYRSNRIARLAALGSIILMGACKDSGLPGKNLPHAQAQVSEWRYPVYQAIAESETLYQVDGRRWQLTGAMETVPRDMLQQVGEGGGLTLHALKWDKAPFDRLYTARPDGKLAVVVPID